MKRIVVSFIIGSFLQNPVGASEKMNKIETEESKKIIHKQAA